MSKTCVVLTAVGVLPSAPTVTVRVVRITPLTTPVVGS